MHCYTVELRIDGKDLDPEEVTKNLGLSPTHVRRKGERRSERSTWPSSVWGVEVFPPGKDNWVSLEEGLQTLLKLVAPARERILSYSAVNAVYLWCGHFSSSFDGGPSLSPMLLKVLGDFGVQLVIDTYCEKEDASDNQSR